MELTAGNIPDGWRSTTFGEICGRITTGKLDANAMVDNGEYPFFTCASDHYWIDKYAFDCEALLVSGNGANVGYVHRYKGKFNAYQRTYVISEFFEDVGFLKLFLDRNLQQRIRTEVNAGNTPYIRMDTLAEMRVILPEKRDEQCAIAEALGDMDALLESLEKLIAKKRDLKQAAMQQLLTGKTRVPGFSGVWQVKQFRAAGSCLRGVSYKGDSDLSPNDTAHTKRLLRANNVQEATVVTSDVQFVNAERVSLHQVLRKDDILICMANGSKALVGKAGFFTVDDGYEYTFGAFMGCFRTNSGAFNPRFVFYLFQTGEYRNYINNLLVGSSINNLRPSSIDSLDFPMPDFAEQTAIAEVLSDMDAELAALEQRLAKTRALKQGMMQELLTGKTRLV